MLHGREGRAVPVRTPSLELFIQPVLGSVIKQETLLLFYGLGVIHM